MGSASSSKIWKMYFLTSQNNEIMNLLIYFSRAWSAEQIRLKHTWIWKLVLLAPLFVCAMYFCIFYFKGEYFVNGGLHAWNEYINHTSRTVFMLFLPLFIILFTLLNQQLDHQANIRKLVYTLPTPQWAQLLAQWLYGLLLYTFTFVLYIVLLLISGWLLSYLRADLAFEQFAAAKLFVGILNGYLASLGILALQFVLSYYFKNMIIPLSIGMAGFITSMVLRQWEHIIYHPFVYPIFAFMETLSEGAEVDVLIRPVLFGIGTAMIVLLAGYWGRKKANLIG